VDGAFATNALPAQSRPWAAAVICTALAMDTAIANIALPAIATDLHASPSEVIWVVNVYQIAMVATLFRSPHLARSTDTIGFTS
jgi:DHA2 family multidrug resistance protein-like MFS transporter